MEDPDESQFAINDPRGFLKRFPRGAMLDEIQRTPQLFSYIQTEVERDVRSIKQIGDLNSFTRFMQLCAGRIGQLLNFTSLANDCGIAVNTAKSWKC